MTMNFLQWDSDFFNKKIASVTVAYGEDEKEVITKIMTHSKDPDLVYINTPENYFFSDEILANRNILLVDNKIVYKKEPVNNPEIRLKPQIRIYTEKSVRPDLLTLALQSGEFSRFKIDPNFPPASFERLYSKWIENSVNGIYANTILTFEEAHKIDGMVTVLSDKTSDLIKIGLIAVDKATQKKGIGTALMAAVENYAIQQSIHNIEVTTQKANKTACSFYEKCNFSIKSINNIYHFWLK
jgi:dTDP-4-amino-4,6-dideoxy-D-galactose acyltransferase